MSAKGGVRTHKREVPAVCPTLKVKRPYVCGGCMLLHIDLVTLRAANRPAGTRLFCVFRWETRRMIHVATFEANDYGLESVTGYVVVAH